MLITFLNFLSQHFKSFDYVLQFSYQEMQRENQLNLNTIESQGLGEMNKKKIMLLIIRDK